MTNLILTTILSLVFIQKSFACLSIPEKFTTGIQGLDGHMQFSFGCDRSQQSTLQLHLPNNITFTYTPDGSNICLSVLSEKKFKDIEDQEMRFVSKMRNIKEINTNMASAYSVKFLDKNVRNLYSNEELRTIETCIRDFPIADQVDGEDCDKNKLISEYNKFREVYDAVNVNKLDEEILARKLSTNRDLHSKCMSSTFISSMCGGTYQDLYPSLHKVFEEPNEPRSGIESIERFYNAYFPSKTKCNSRISECAKHLHIGYYRMQSKGTVRVDGICNEFNKLIVKDQMTVRPSDLVDKNGNVIGNIEINGKKITIRTHNGNQSMEVELTDKEGVVRVKEGERTLGVLTQNNELMCNNFRRGSNTRDPNKKYSVLGSRAKLQPAAGCGDELITENLDSPVNPHKGSTGGFNRGIK